MTVQEKGAPLPSRNAASTRTLGPILAALLLLALGSLLACSPIRPEERQFIIPVDSMVVPDTVGAQDTLFVRLLGIIGPNGCYQFTHFEVEREPGRLRITAMGREALAAGCYAVLMELDKVISAPPPFVHPFLVEAVRSENEVLRKTVAVREEDLR